MIQHRYSHEWYTARNNTILYKAPSNWLTWWRGQSRGEAAIHRCRHEHENSENDERAQGGVAYRSLDVEDLSERVELGLSGLGPPGADCGRQSV